MVLAVVAPGAYADPNRPRTVAQARAEVDKLTEESASASQQFLEAEGRVKASQKRVATQTADLKELEKKVAAMRAQISTFMLSNFQRKEFSLSVVLASGNTADFLRRARTVQNYTNQQLNLLRVLAARQTNLTDLNLSLKDEADKQRAALSDMEKARKLSEKKLAEAKQVLNSLTAAERQRLEDERERERAAQQRAAEQDQPDSPGNSNQSSKNRKTKPSRSESAPPPSLGGSSRAAIAVAFAKAQVGKPWSQQNRFGPNQFDCSGLTSRAWREAGVKISLVSQTQIRDGVAVSRSDIRPGDLVFYYPGITHVGIYIGGGQIVDAANVNTGVRYAKLESSSRKLQGIRRVG